MVDPRVQFTLRDHHFMMAKNPGWDEPKFQVQGARATITSEFVAEGVQAEGITMDTL